MPPSNVLPFAPLFVVVVVHHLVAPTIYVLALDNGDSGGSHDDARVLQIVRRDVSSATGILEVIHFVR